MSGIFLTIGTYLTFFGLIWGIFESAPLGLLSSGGGLALCAIGLFME